MKSWMEYCCTCPSCLKQSEDEYSLAFELWNKGIRRVELKSWDNLPETYGTTMYINGVDVGEVEANPLAMIGLLCEFLGIDNVKTDYISDDLDVPFYEDE